MTTQSERLAAFLSVTNEPAEEALLKRWMTEDSTHALLDELDLQVAVTGEHLRRHGQDDAIMGLMTTMIARGYRFCEQEYQRAVETEAAAE